MLNECLLNLIKTLYNYINSPTRKLARIPKLVLSVIKNHVLISGCFLENNNDFLQLIAIKQIKRISIRDKTIISL